MVSAGRDEKSWLMLWMETTNGSMGAVRRSCNYRSWMTAWLESELTPKPFTQYPEAYSFSIMRFGRHEYFLLDSRQ